MFPLLTVQDASEETRKIYSLEEGKEKLLKDFGLMRSMETTGNFWNCTGILASQQGVWGIDEKTDGRGILFL